MPVVTRLIAAAWVVARSADVGRLRGRSQMGRQRDIRNRQSGDVDFACTVAQSTRDDGVFLLLIATAAWPAPRTPPHVSRSHLDVTLTAVDMRKITRSGRPARQKRPVLIDGQKFDLAQRRRLLVP